MLLAGLTIPSTESAAAGVAPATTALATHAAKTAAPGTAPRLARGNHFVIVRPPLDHPVRFADPLFSCHHSSVDNRYFRYSA
jgi:hypothetical protein